MGISQQLDEYSLFDKQGEAEGLLNPEDRDRIEMVLKYIEDGDLCRWKLPDIKAFNIGLSGWRSKFNSITNPCMYEQVGQPKF